VAQDITDSGRELGTEDVSTDPDGREGTEGNPGSQGVVGDNDDVSVVGSTGGGSRRKVVALQGQAHYKPKSSDGEIGTLIPVNMYKMPLPPGIENPYLRTNAARTSAFSINLGPFLPGC
jgi:hypothetical protein